MCTHRLLFCGQVFIVQLNVFACERPVHEVYDLKGSSYKRAASEREKQAAFVVLKDIDFKSDPNRAIKLAPVRHSLTHSVPVTLTHSSPVYSLTLCKGRLSPVSPCSVFVCEWVALTMSCAGLFRERRSPLRRS